MKKAPALSAFTDEDIAFLEDQNSINRGTPLTVTIGQGHMRQLDYGVKQQFENITKRVIKESFVLCFHCQYEVFEMVKDLYAKYDEYKAANAPAEEQATETGDSNEIKAAIAAFVNAEKDFGADSHEAQEAAAHLDALRAGGKDAPDGSNGYAGQPTEIPPVTLGNTPDGKPIVETVSVVEPLKPKRGRKPADK